MLSVTVSVTCETHILRTPLYRHSFQFHTIAQRSVGITGGISAGSLDVRSRDRTGPRVPGTSSLLARHDAIAHRIAAD